MGQQQPVHHYGYLSHIYANLYGFARSRQRWHLCPNRFLDWRHGHLGCVLPRAVFCASSLSFIVCDGRSAAFELSPVRVHVDLVLALVLCSTNEHSMNPRLGSKRKQMRLVRLHLRKRLYKLLHGRRKCYCVIPLYDFALLSLESSNLHEEARLVNSISSDKDECALGGNGSELARKGLGLV